jgi:pyruvate/2-oxoglutarate dehydrogenase complex dihydrolipoamide dehydrogenase (E3) component
MVEALPRLAPAEEPEISNAIAQVLADEGIEVLVSTSISAVGWDGTRPRVRLEGGVKREVGAEMLLVATGRHPNTSGLGLEEVGVELGPNGQVVVDSGLRTPTPRVWAGGDVTGVVHAGVDATEGQEQAEDGDDSSDPPAAGQEQPGDDTAGHGGMAAGEAVAMGPGQQHFDMR